jgi:catalase
MWINEAGVRSWVKYHLISCQGIEGLTGAEAVRIAGQDTDSRPGPLRGNRTQPVPEGDTVGPGHVTCRCPEDYRFNPFDLIKIWPHSGYPLIKIATMTLNKNPDNFFAQIQRAPFSAGNTVAGIGFPERMLPGRTFARPNADRNRIGTTTHRCRSTARTCPSAPIRSTPR